jgi:hypothetical protein
MRHSQEVHEALEKAFDELLELSPEEIKARHIDRRLAKYLRDKEEITEEDIEEAAERETQDSLIFEEAEALANRFNI